MNKLTSIPDPRKGFEGKSSKWSLGVASAVLKPRRRTHLFGGWAESEYAAAGGKFGWDAEIPV